MAERFAAEACGFSIGALVVPTYGGGGGRGVCTGMRESVNELECEGRWFFNTDKARAKIELLVGWTGCVECGARMNCVTSVVGGEGLGFWLFGVSSSSSSNFAWTMDGEGGLTRIVSGVGGYECMLELLARCGSGVSSAGPGLVMFVRQVNARAASA